MNKFTSACLVGLLGIPALAQEVQQLPAQPTTLDVESVQRRTVETTATTEAVIWSEDFSNGIPSTWTNAGFDGSNNPLASALWEYRGPSTTPDVTQGTRGAFGAPNDPILSASASNGFIIFDSDYLDNGGVPTATGQGPAPAPHIGTLTTDVIDLSSEPFVMLEFSNYARIFYANLQVAMSIDGGATWNDTITAYDYVNLGVNGVTDNAETLRYNVSNEIGGQANVQLRFIFDGTPGNTNGNGYYFWILDDITLSTLPVHSLRFVDYNGAPANDIIYGNGGGKYGIHTLKQTRPIAFDSNIENFGSATQNNVQLEVQIWNSSNNLVQSLSSPTTSVTSGGVADYNTINTAAWTPTAEDTYTIVYLAKSDSVNGVDADYATDTFQIYVTDSLMSLDFNRFDNRLGTDEIGDDGSALTTRLDLVNDERLFGVDIWLSAATVAGGVIEVTVYDTTGFTITGGFTSTPLAYNQHTVTAQDVSNRVIQMSLTDASGNPIYLSTQNTGAYQIVVTMYSNAGANPVEIRNDQTFPQSATASYMYYTAQGTPQWYSGFENSLDLNALHIRAITCAASTAASCMTIGVEEISLDSQLDVYPNPVNDVVFVDFGDVSGQVELSLMDLSGRAIWTRGAEATRGGSLPIEMGELTPGVYFLNVQNGEAVSTFKLTVQ